MLFDPTKDKCLNIYVAKTWPAWQQRYIDLVREQLDEMTLDAKSIAQKVEKADMKRAMPFIQELKRKLESGAEADTVLDRHLGFDEVAALNEMVPVLKSTVPRLRGVSIIVVDEQGRDGGQNNTGATGNGSVKMSQTAGSAEPGTPSIEFLNV
jgi:leucyl-tRNA synthetase